MSSPIHQIAVTHSQVEDRLLVGFRGTDGSEVNFWLTRKFTGGLWEILKGILGHFPDLRGILDAEARAAVLAMRHEEAVRGSDVSRSSPETQDGTGGAVRAYLVTSVSCHMISDTVARLDLTAREGSTITINLNESLLHAFCHALLETTRATDWGLDLRVGGDIGRVARSSSAAIH